MFILNFYIPVFEVITSIQHEPEKHTDYNCMKEFILNKLDYAVRETEQYGLSEKECDAAFYAIVVMLDETVMCSELKFKREWCDNPLQLHFFGHFTGGQRFYSLLDELIETKSSALYIFLFCLLLGFRGQYVDCVDDINNYISIIKNKMGLSDDSEILSPCIYNVNNKKYPHNRYCFFTILLVYIAISFFLFLR